MDIKLIRMFNKALPGKEVDYEKIAEEAKEIEKRQEEIL